MAGQNVIRWLGSSKCDLCGCECKEELIDGKTSFGPWATMCKSCFFENGLGLGLGLGQRYVRGVDGCWVKVVG